MDLFGDDYSSIIVNKTIPINTRYLVVDLCLSSKDSIRELCKLKDEEIKNYILNTKIVSNDDIKDLLGNLDIRDEIKDYVFDIDKFSTKIVIIICY